MKIESQAGLAPGMAEALAEATDGLLSAELVTDEDMLVGKELLPD